MAAWWSLKQWKTVGCITAVYFCLSFIVILRYWSKFGGFNMFKSKGQTRIIVRSVTRKLRPRDWFPREQPERRRQFSRWVFFYRVIAPVGRSARKHHIIKYLDPSKQAENINIEVHKWEFKKKKNRNLSLKWLLKSVQSFCGYFRLHSLFFRYSLSSFFSSTAVFFFKVHIYLENPPSGWFSLLLSLLTVLI